MKIESGIPMPENLGKQTAGKYRFDDWKVGDSWYLDDLAQADSAQTSAKAWADRRGNNARFSRAKEGEGYRLWRIA